MLRILLIAYVNELKLTKKSVTDILESTATGLFLTPKEFMVLTYVWVLRMKSILGD